MANSTTRRKLGSSSIEHTTSIEHSTLIEDTPSIEH